MSSVTQTQTMSATVTASTAHVAATLQNVTLELDTIAAHLARLGVAVQNTDFDCLLLDIGIFCLFGCLRSVSAQLVREDRVWTAWEYVVADHPLSPVGPSPDNPPLPQRVPPGTRLRIVVDKAPNVSEEEFNGRLAARGWKNAASIPFVDGMVAQEYGVFANAGFAVKRVLHTVPSAFEQKVSTSQQGERR